MTKVKICGITNVVDALAAAQVGADYLGYIINVPTSPRSISPITATLIISAVRHQFPKVKHVGVFVNMPSNDMNNVVAQAEFDVVQLHGDETPAEIKLLTAPFVWKKVNADEVETYQAIVDGLLFDAGAGSGEVLPQAIVEQIAAMNRYNKTVIVAGGITPNNVKEIIAAARPDVVDVNSGVEKQPGQKDPVKLKQLFTAIGYD